MKIEQFKIGSLCKINAKIFAYDHNPLQSLKKWEHDSLDPADTFVILDYYDFDSKNIFIVKILVKDKIRYIVSAINNLIEIKEE